MRTERKERTAFFTTKPGVSLFFFRLAFAGSWKKKKKKCVCVLWERMIFFRGSNLVFSPARRRRLCENGQHAAETDQIFFFFGFFLSFLFVSLSRVFF